MLVNCIFDTFKIKAILCSQIHLTICHAILRQTSVGWTDTDHLFQRIVRGAGDAEHLLAGTKISGQGNAIGTADDTSIWSFLRTGNFTVDAATKAQAQADIAEDGYWGVKQTSDRIVDFAKALCGGDPDKIEEMREAFEKGFKQAEKTWGGELPEISKKTYDAVMEKFDAWANENKSEAVTE